MKKYSNFNNKSQKNIKLLSPLLLFLIFILTLATTFIIKTKTSEKVNKVEVEKTVKIPENNNYIKETNQAEKHDEIILKEDEQKRFIMPVSGDIFLGFSDNKLVFNKTTKDWRLHQAIDISANMGTIVKSMNDGKIVDIKADLLRGNIISIEHKDKIIVSYCNVDIIKELKIGDNVNRGMLIGYIKENPPFESEETLHLHIEITKNNKLSDINSIEFE